MSAFAGVAIVVLAGAAVPRAPAQAPEPRKFAFRAAHYEVSAALDPARHFLTARSRIEFVATAPSRTLEVELHRDLKVSAVHGADRKPLPFERVEDTAVVRVTLPDAKTTGDKAALTFEYSGPLAEEESSAPGGVRLAYVGEEGCYLLQSAGWFPLTGVPANRYTANFEISVPDKFAVVGTGKSASPVTARGPAPAAPDTAPAPQQSPVKARAKAAPPRAAEPAPPPPRAPIAPAGSLVYTFRSERPAVAGTFVAGNLLLTPVNAEGMNIPVYTPAEAATSAKEYGEALARILHYFSGEFGPLFEPAATLAQLPNVPAAPQGFAAPGLLLVHPRQWDPRLNYRLLAQLAARQWWENEVLPSAAADAWLSDGLARYSEALYVLHLAGQEGFYRALEDFAVGALMYEDAAPIAQAARLERFSAEYRSVVEYKGAMVFHMLRGQMGDEAFRALLREYYKRFAGKAARIEDFQALVAEKTAAAAAVGNSSPGSSPAVAPFNLQAFFTQWIHSTGVPEFKLDYVVLRTKKGFRITGKVKQELETFRMPVEVKVETEGNPEVKTIEVLGANSDFTVETFGRPKPGGIVLDPNNQLLKASPRLRVRAAIARGEAFAQEGKYYDAIKHYESALELQKNSSLAKFRMGEGYFYQKNLQAAASAFRDAIDGDRDPKWIEVWCHIYLGKIFDLGGLRERAINEYTRAKELNDDTGGAQAEADKYLKQPYQEEKRP